VMWCWPVLLLRFCSSSLPQPPSISSHLVSSSLCALSPR
jgi:hypothetical protein